MIHACPYCGAPMGDGHPSHLTALLVPEVGSASTFRRIDIGRILRLEPPPTEVRAITTCSGADCIAKASKVRL